MYWGFTVLLFILFAPLRGHSVLTEARKDARPNVIFILTDDQDLHMNSLDYLPYVKKHLTGQGTYFKKHYCTVAICCPSRVNLWTGRAAHNTNVTDVSMPYGGYPKIVQEGILDNYLFTWLEEAGYANYYVGKLFNQHTTTNYDSPFPKGFTEHVSGNNYISGRQVLIEKSRISFSIQAPTNTIIAGFSGINFPLQITKENTKPI